MSEDRCLDAEGSFLGTYTAISEAFNGNIAYQHDTENFVIFKGLVENTWVVSTKVGGLVTFTLGSRQCAPGTSNGVKVDYEEGAAINCKKKAPTSRRQCTTLDGSGCAGNMYRTKNSIYLYFELNKTKNICNITGVLAYFQK